jgi:uncharacterized protein Usg
VLEAQLLICSRKFFRAGKDSVELLQAEIDGPQEAVKVMQLRLPGSPEWRLSL